MNYFVFFVYESRTHSNLILRGLLYIYIYACIIVQAILVRTVFTEVEEILGTSVTEAPAIETKIS